jgi:hypothetical protein
VVRIKFNPMSFAAQNNSSVLKFTDKMKSLFNEKLNKISDLYAPESKKSMPPLSDADKIVLVLPLSGRYETFLRFLSNYEDVSELFSTHMPRHDLNSLFSHPHRLFSDLMIMLIS